MSKFVGLFLLHLFVGGLIGSQINDALGRFYIIGFPIILFGGMFLYRQYLNHVERLKHKEYERQFDAQLQMMRRIVGQSVGEHQSILIGKWRECKDEYDTVDQSRWTQEVKRFVQSVVEPKVGVRIIPSPSNGQSTATFKSVYDQITSEVARLAQDMLEFSYTDAVPLDPVDFKHYCANILREIGWNAKVTQGSGDQGADVIATADKKTLVLQCKRYSGSIGNMAVQEVLAAQVFYRATYAAVVGTAPFTRSARQLAASANVRLVDESGLRTLKPSGL